MGRLLSAMASGDQWTAIQIWAVYTIIRQFKWNRRARATVLHAAVRSGKTRISLDFADIWNGNKKILVVTPSIEICTQWEKTANELFPGRWTIGMLGGGRGEFGHEMTIATIDSATAYIDTILNAGNYGLMIFDECHRSLSPSGITIVDTFLQKTDGKVLFVTATMGRSDGQILSRWSSGVAISLDHQTMVRMGVNVEAETHFSQSDDPAVVYDKWWDVAYGMPTLVFTKTKRDAERWVRYWNKMGHKAETIFGEHSPAERQRILDRYRNGETIMLANAGVLTEGVDINTTQCVILAERPATDTPEYQRIGRALGSNGGIKDRAVAIICGHDRSKGAAITMPGYQGDTNMELRNRSSKLGRAWNTLMCAIKESV